MSSNVNPNEDTTKKQSACPNCQYSFEQVNKFCPSCGQPNKSHKRPIRYFVWEFFEELLSLDARVFGTLRDLVLVPGLLTKNYNADKRAQYTSPLRFYVLTSVLFFLTLSWVTQSTIRESDSQLTNAIQKDDSLFSNMNATLLWNFKLTPADFRALQNIDVYTAESIDSVLTAQGKDTGWFNTRVVLGLSPLFTGRFSLAQYYRKLLQNFSYALFFLMPILALLLKLLYIRRHQFYTEHLIFSIHLHTFSFLLILVCLWIDYFQDFFSITSFSILGVMIYMAMAMKVVYEQGWLKTLMKGAFVFWLYLLFVFVGFSFLVLLSLF